MSVQMMGEKAAAGCVSEAPLDESHEHSMNGFLPEGWSEQWLKDLSKRPLFATIRLLQMSWLRFLYVTAVFIFKHSPVVCYPLYVEYLIRTVSDKSGPQVYTALLWPSVGMFVLLLLNIPTHGLYISLVSSHVRRFEKNLRSALITKLQLLSMGFYQQRSSGELQAKVLRDVEQIEQLIRFVMNALFQISFAMISALAITAHKEPWMLLFYAVSIPASIGIMRLFRRVLNRRNAAFRQEIEKMSSAVSEMIQMIPVTKAHGLEGLEISKVKGHLESIYEKGKHLDRGNAYFESSSFVIFQLTQFSCLVVTGGMCAKGWISISEVVLYQALLGLLVHSVNSLLAMVPQLSKGLESMRSLHEVLQCEDMDQKDNGKILKLCRGHLQFDGVQFSYGKEWSLKPLSLNIWPGECLAFVGESGSGKSTLMNLIIGFEKATAGQIMVDGVSMSKLQLSSWRRHLAVVSQNVLLFSGSLKDNICYGMESVSTERLNEVIEAAQLKSVVDQWPEGLDTLVGENGVKLSGGQRQRIAIARALIRDPKVIILDEATSALDVISEREVQKALEVLCENRTTLIVAHRLSTIRQAHRIAVMKDGAMVELGSHEELLAQGGEFWRLHSLQA